VRVLAQKMLSVGAARDAIELIPFESLQDGATNFRLRSHCGQILALALPFHAQCVTERSCIEIGHIPW
jgi:hypothetical protein